VRLLSASEAQRESLGVHRAVHSRNVQTLVDAPRQHLTPSEFDAASAASAAMSLDQVLADLADTEQPDSTLQPLLLPLRAAAWATPSQATS
jgi:hypothetical protein